jgi:hypothetical protein
LPHSGRGKKAVFLGAMALRICCLPAPDVVKLVEKPWQGAPRDLAHAADQLALGSSALGNILSNYIDRNLFPHEIGDILINLWWALLKQIPDVSQPEE